MPTCIHAQASEFCPLCIRDSRIKLLEAFAVENGAILSGYRIMVKCRNCDPARCHCKCHTTLERHCINCTAHNSYTCNNMTITCTCEGGFVQWQCAEKKNQVSWSGLEGHLERRKDLEEK